MKMKRLVYVCFIASAVLFLALPAIAKDGAIEVKCVDASGNPMPNVKVVIQSFNNLKMRDKRSDAQGAAEFTKVDDGVYRVFGRKDSFAPALFEPILLKEATENVTLKFASGADKKFYFEDQAEAQRARAIMKEAFDAYQQNKFEEAEKLFAQALELFPSNAEGLYYYSVSCLQQMKFDQGVQLLKRTEEVSNALKSLSTAPPAAGQKPAQNPYERIYDSVEQLLKKIPEIKGENALKQRKYDDAIADFSEAVKNNPNSAEDYANLAIALGNAKRYDEALPPIEKAIQMKPEEKGYVTLRDDIVSRKQNAEIDKAQALLNEGKTLLQSGDAAGSLKKFEEAKALVPQDKQSPLWLQIARAQAKLNQPDVAVASFKKSIELAPEDKASEFRRAFAQYYLDANKYEEAVNVLADIKEAGSKSPEQVLVDLAATSRDREPKLAEAALERVIKINPANADAYFDLGQMYYADGKEKDSRAKELLTKFVGIGKDSAKIETANNMLVMINRRSK